MTTYTEQQKACIDRVREALPEFTQQDDYLLANGASVMSEVSHEIIHVDTLRKIVDAVLAAKDAQGEPTEVARLDKALDQVMRERDDAEELGTRLAEKVGEYLGVDVGEHSSANDPRLAAIEALDTASPLSRASDAPATAAHAGAMRPETTSEHIARDIREGRFPARSEPQMVADTAPTAAVDDETTVYDPAFVRQKFQDYQRQIDGLNEELAHLRASTLQAGEQAGLTEAGWKTGTPPVPEGKSREFIIAVRRAQSKPAGKVFVFSANYANNFTDDGCLSDRSGDEFIAHGWHLCGLDMSGEFNEVYEPIGLGDGDEILGWQELPEWNDALLATTPNSAADKASDSAAGKSMGEAE